MGKSWLVRLYDYALLNRIAVLSVSHDSCVEVFWVLECMELYRHCLLFRDHNKMKVSYRSEGCVRVYNLLVDATLNLREFNLLLVQKPVPGCLRRLVNRTPGLSQQNGCHEADGHDHLLCRHDCVSWTLQALAPNILARHLRKLVGLDKMICRTDKNRYREQIIWWDTYTFLNEKDLKERKKERKKEKQIGWRWSWEEIK